MRKLTRSYRDRSQTLLHFSVDVNITDIPDLDQEDRDLVSLGINNTSVPFAVDVALGELNKCIGDLILLSNISRPGSISTESGYSFVDGILFKQIRGFRNEFSHAVEDAEKLQWPPINVLPLVDVLIWAKKIPGFPTGKSETPLGRAMGALSYLLKTSFDNENPLGIIWALLGLEALYSSGHLDLSRQLREKTEVYLGARTQYKKKFNQAYDFRSRLIHGDMNMPLSYYAVEDEAYEKFAFEAMDAEYLMIATLISTLQKMCHQKVYDLQFKYTLEGE